MTRRRDRRDDWGWDEAREVSEGEEIAALLALSAEPVEPDPALRRRLMESIAAVDRERRGALRRRLGLLATAAASAGIAAGLTWAFQAEAPVGGRAAPGAPALEAAIAAAEDAEARVAELEEMLDEQDAEILDLERTLSRARDALEVLVAERVQRLDLSSAAGLDAKARVYWDWDDYTCYLVAEGLPAAPSGEVYVLWLTTDEGELLRAGTLAAAGGARATFYAKLPQDMGHVVRAAITRETEPSGDAPRGAVLLSGEV